MNSANKPGHIGVAGVFGMACVAIVGQAQAQTQPQTLAMASESPVAPITVYGHEEDGTAAQARYDVQNADMGPLGNRPILNTPMSVSIVPDELIDNAQAQTVNDTLRYLPSVEVRDQQGLEVSRPQSRGFQGTIVQNTRLDGLNIIGTTAIASEDLSGIEVLNGMAGALYGPETPAGVFNYMLKRPTATPMLRYIEGYNSDGIFTEQMDASGPIDPDHRFGFRLDLVHGEGEDYVAGSNANRTLLSGGLDFHPDASTVVETNFSYYETSAEGLPGGIVYDSGASTILPRAINPATPGLGQTYAGTDLITTTGLIKIKHDFGNGWNLEVGGLYQDALRNLWGVTNTFTNNSGDYNTTKNFTAVPHFTVGSNMAQLNGHVRLFGMTNDVSIGVNGFINGQYSYRDSIAVPLGSSNLSNPAIFANKPLPNNGGQYLSDSLFNESIVTADTIHFNSRWALQGVISTSFLSQTSYGTTGKITSQDSRDGIVSPTVSLIYKPFANLTTYATYSNSVEEGEEAPAGSANVNQFLAPYHDEQYEIGAKYALLDHMLITVDAFRMTRPLADTVAPNDVFQVIGIQRNEGAEVFAQGSITSALSVLGGVTYIDARLQNTGVVATNDKLVVGVPEVKSDISLDYHPHFFDGFALTGAVHVESERAATNTNNSFAPAYATVDLGARYSTRLFSHQTTVRFQVMNLTDTFYYSSVADGNIVGSAGANTAYYGAPRTFMASLEVDY